MKKIIDQINNSSFSELSYSEMIETEGGESIFYWIGYAIGKIIKAGCASTSSGNSPCDVGL